LASEPRAGATLRGETITGFEWAEADLTEAVFVDCLIEAAQFGSVILEGARFTNCRVLRSRFARADLREAVFEDCVFTETTEHTGLAVAFSRLEAARFVRCDLSFIRFEGAEMHGVILEDCNLRGAAFRRADFTRNLGRRRSVAAAVFRRCNFHLADLAGVALPGCDLAGSQFRETDLSGADLEGADLRDTDLFGALLSDAKLAGADLRRAELSGVDLLGLATRVGIKITLDQQYPLLTALGVDVHVE
jgi:fluoroquinolone resistance protein